MSFELKWLMYTVLLTGLLWMPYILNRVIVRGMIPAMGNPSPDDKPHSPWAERALKAHANAVENLVLFAPAVLAIHVLGISTPLTQKAVVVYFAARLAHYIVYVIGVPVLRTLIFVVNLIAIFAIVFAALGAT